MGHAKHKQDRRNAPESADADVLDSQCWVVSSPEGAVLHVGARATRMPLAKAEVFLEHLRHRGFTMLDFSQRFQLTRVLVAGAQGSVYEALELATGTAFAVKVAKGAEKMAALWQESRFLYELRRVDGIVGIKGVYEFRADGQRCLAVVLERLDSSLVPLLASPMDEDACRLVMRQLLTTVKAIHDQGVIHGDIKPANVLVKNADGAACGLTVKLADFGLASRGLPRRCGTVGIAAPAVFALAAVLKPATDVFACGVVLRCLVLGPEATSPLQASEGAFPPLPGHVSADCASLLNGACHPDPRMRWSVESALACSWLARGGAASGEARA